jgi:tetratricopeptide (TPR) repeat protein
VTSVAPADPRGKFYRGVAFVLSKERPGEAERLLQEYAKVAPRRNAYPSPAVAHVWLGRLYESQNRAADAQREFETALRLDPKNRLAQEAVKKSKKKEEVSRF